MTQVTDQTCQGLPNLSNSKLASGQHPWIQRKWKSLYQNHCLSVKAGKLESMSLKLNRHLKKEDKVQNKTKIIMRK